MAMSTMFPKFSKKREGDNVVMEQKLLQTTNNLVLDVKECAGCGICVEACPEEAITIGLVGAAKRGAIDEPAINVDEEKCSYCGVCVCLCYLTQIDSGESSGRTRVVSLKLTDKLIGRKRLVVGYTLGDSLTRGVSQ